MKIITAVTLIKIQGPGMQNVKKKTNLIITGSSGYVGTALLRKLGDYEVFAIDRKNLKQEYTNVKFSNFDLSTDLEKLKEFSSLLETIVVHLAAARSDDADESDYKKDNIRATENFLKNLNPGHIKLFIHVGSVAALDGEKIIAEKRRIIGSDDWYRVTKYEQQQLIEDWSVANNVPLVILAPSAVYDSDAKSNQTNVGRLERAIRIFKILPRIDTKKSLTPMNMLIDAIKSFVEQNQYYKNENSPLKIQRFLVIERPVISINEICKRRFGAKYTFWFPGLFVFLLLLAKIIKTLRIAKYIPLTQNRIVKLFKSTDYQVNSKYGDWHAHETNSH
jgi:nucleoside-diphosphate-sugar epimerase